MISASEVTGNSSVRFECQPSKNLLKQLRDDEGETKFIGRDKKVYQTPKNNGSLKAVADRSLQSIPQPIFAVGPSSGPESITGSTAPSALLAAARNSSSHFSAGSSLSNSGHGYGSSNDSVATVSNVIYPLSPCLSSQPASSLLILSMECLNDSEENISTDLRTSSGKLPPGRTNMAYGAQVPSQGQNIPIPPESNDLPHASASTAYNSNGYFLGAQHQIQEGLYQQYQQQQQRQQQLYQYPNVYEPYQIRSNGHRQMPDRSIYYGPVQTQYQSHVLPHQVPIMPQLQSEEFIYASQGGSIPLPGIPIPIGYTVHNPGYNEVSTNQRIMYPSVPVFSTPSVGVHYGYYPYTQHLGQNNDGTVSVSPVAYSYSTSTSGSETPVPGTYTPVSVAYTSHSRSPAEYNSVPVPGDGTSQHRSYQSTDPSTVSNDTNQQQPLQNKSKKKKMPNDVVKKRFYRGP